MTNYNLYAYLKNNGYPINMKLIQEFKPSISRRQLYKAIKENSPYNQDERHMTSYDKQIIHGMIKAKELYGIKKKSLFYILHNSNIVDCPFIVLVIKQSDEYIINQFSDETINLLYDNLFHVFDTNDFDTIQSLKEIKREEGVSSYFKKRVAAYHKRLKKKHGVDVNRSEILSQYFNINDDVIRNYRKLDLTEVLLKYVSSDNQSISLDINNDYFYLYNSARRKGLTLKELVENHGYKYNTKAVNDSKVMNIKEELSKISDENNNVCIPYDTKLYRMIYFQSKKNNLTIEEFLNTIDFKRIYKTKQM